MRPGRRTPGLRPACCMRASGSGRWSSIAAPPTGGCRRSSASGRCRSTGASSRLDCAAAAEAEWQVAPPAVRDALTRYAEGVNAHMAALDRPAAAARVSDSGLRRRPRGRRSIRWRSAGCWRGGWRKTTRPSSCGMRWRRASGPTKRCGSAARYPANAPSVVQGPATAGHQPTPETAPPAGPEAAARARSGGLRRSSGQPLASLTKASAPSGNGRTGSSGCTRRAPRRFEQLGHRRATDGERPAAAGQRSRTCRWSFPGVWYEMHLVAAGLDVIGVTIPGTPFVILGHNARIAWGMTNTGADVQDLFVERLDLARRRYLFQGQWLPVAGHARRDPGPRRCGAGRSRSGARGTGASSRRSGSTGKTRPAWLSPAAERQGERRAFALRWEHRRRDGGRVRSAQSRGDWSDFTAAVERFAAPSQNFVYADVEGNIGYAMSGVLPLRSASVGTMPNDGTTGEGEWTARYRADVAAAALQPAARLHHLVEQPDRSASGRG